MEDPEISTGDGTTRSRETGEIAEKQRPQRPWTGWIFPLWTNVQGYLSGRPDEEVANSRKGSPHAPTTETTGSQALLAAFRRYNRAYFQRWLILGALIGVVAGLGAIAFYSAIAFTTHLFLGGIAGFTPPSPAGEGATVITPITRR